MLAGEAINGCEVCYKDEAHGKMSLRQTMNDRWKFNLGEQEFQSRLRQSEKSEGRLESPPVYFDLRLGNQCNLKCRMCFPINSHKLNDEFKEILSTEKNFPQYIKDQLVEDKVLNWGDSSVFAQSLREILPSIQELYFTGGEPMMISAVYEILKKAVDLKMSSHIKISFHTNTTLWNSKLIDLLPFFKSVHIICSIDGVGAVDEYIRTPTQFKKVESNFQNYLQLSKENPNIYIGIGSAISWLNVYGLPDFALWLSSQQVRAHLNFCGVFFNIVYEPQLLNFKMIPNELRSHARQCVLKALTTFEEQQILTPRIQSDLTTITNILETPANFCEGDSRDLVQYLSALDHQRKQNLKEMIPDAYKVFQHHEHICSQRPLEL